MNLSVLAKFVLALLLNHAGPGKSVYSMQTMPECGTDSSAATCPLDRVCAGSSPVCAAPRWSKARGAWVRVEDREHAAARFERAAFAIARAATYLIRCKDAEGVVIEDCRPVKWPEGTHSFAFAMLASSLWESGYREDIMAGMPPSGRGPDGEVCVMQVMPDYIKQHADWTPAKPPKEMALEDWAQEILGTDVEHLTRCYLVGGRMLSRLRQTAQATCRGSNSFYSMYAMYGTGGRCSTKGSALGDWASRRATSYYNFMRAWPNGTQTPDWAMPLYGQLTPAAGPGVPLPEDRKKPARPSNFTLQGSIGGDDA